MKYLYKHQSEMLKKEPSGKLGVDEIIILKWDLK
jgi:hypothetical protein